RSLEAFTHMGLNPAKRYRCRTYALGRVTELLYRTSSLNPTLGRLPSPSVGFSLQQLADIAEQSGIGMVPVNWGDHPQLVVPSVIHWKENHYAALIEQHGRWFKVADPTLDQHPVMLRYEDIIAEASGYFLVPKGQEPVGWRKAEPREARRVYGRGYATVVGDSHDEPGCPFGSSPGGVPGSAPGNSAGGAGAGCGGVCSRPTIRPGMPFWAVSEPYINVWIFDTPLSYQPSLGAEVAVRLMWRERGLDMFTWFNTDKFSVFGVGWCSPWRAAVTPASFDDSGYAVGAMFLGSGAHLYAEFFNWATISEHNYFNNTKLERVVNPSTHEETSNVVHYP